jgi:TatD DNase family protein
MLIDSHCHLDQLDLNAYDNNLDNVINDAKAVGVEYCLNVCIDRHNMATVVEIANQYDNVWASVGIHPNEKPEDDCSVEQLLEYGNQAKVVAIGETGLDYFRSEGDLTWQQQRFRRHIGVARELLKPIIIHSRDAADDTITIAQQEKIHEVGGVLHCFTGTLEMAQQAMDLGLYISFSGIVTFKNALELQQVAKAVPLSQMLIETDAPYLAPVPKRGKPNYPAYVKYVAEYLAELKGCSYEELSTVTSDNFFKLFSDAKPKI